MEDVLDFSADFWEKRLDYEPESVDNIYSKETKGLSYAIDDYCGFDPVSEWVQTSTEEEGRLPAVGTSKGRSKRRTKAKGVKHHAAKS
jgi:hypothetical protein